MLMYAIVFITFALGFYSIGVWSEKVQGNLKKWHLWMFWIGIIFDTLGTFLMSKIAGEGLSVQFHSVTGMIALVLMLFHAVWATIVLFQNNPRKREKFHQFSIFVWFIWLIPYISGAIFGMSM